MDRLQQQLMRQLGMGGAGVGADVPVVDTAETVYISSLALLKMLKHGACARGVGALGGPHSRWRAGVPPPPRPPPLTPCAAPYPRPPSPQAARACPWRSWA
jgi:hypothetical protein